MIHSLTLIYMKRFLYKPAGKGRDEKPTVSGASLTVSDHRSVSVLDFTQFL